MGVNSPWGETGINPWAKHRNLLGYLSADIICSEKRTVFRDRSSKKSASFKEQVMLRTNEALLILGFLGIRDIRGKNYRDTGYLRKKLL